MARAGDTILSSRLIENIAADIEEGCYATVAAARNGIGHYSLYLWDQRGKREAEQREELHSDAPPTIYEQFHRRLEQAKATARYGAETRVYRTQPLQWLRSGYARADWHEADAVMELEQRVIALEALLAEARQQKEVGADVSSNGHYTRVSVPYEVIEHLDVMEQRTQVLAQILGRTLPKPSTFTRGIVGGRRLSGQ